MRQRFVLLCALVVLAAGVECPIQPPGNSGYRFTSADLRQSNNAWWTWGGLPAAGRDEDAQAGGEDVPREVTEPDVFRREGDILYVLNQYRGLTLVDLDTEEVLAQLPTFGYPRDLYVRDGRAYVLAGQAANYETNGNTVSYTVQGRLYIADVSTPASASVLSSIALDGDFVDSRLVGDVLYAVCAEFDWYWDGVTATKNQTSATWVTSVNVADPGNVYPADQLSFGGAGDVIQATSTAIFVASAPVWSREQTTITYVDISDPAGAMTVRGAVNVNGYVADRYKLDAWEGALRVVSCDWNDERRVYVTTISFADPDHLTVLAELPLERATGETLFATRFDGPRAYIVTFLVQDPLFVVDLSDPSAPALLGELEVPGWSTHIEPRGDRLLALGVDDTGGRRVCVSLFDVADPGGPVLVDRETFGEAWSWSSAYGDVKAFAVFDDLLIVPFSGWSGAGGYERLQFVSWSPDGLDVRGCVDLTGAAIRSFDYTGNYYGLTTEQLVTIDAAALDAPNVTNRLVLAEYLADFVEITPQTAAEIVARYDTGKTLVRTASLANTAGGEVEVELGDLVDSLVYGNSVVLIGARWDESPHYVVAVIDCSDPEQPRLAFNERIPVEPYYGWYWPLYPDRPLLEVDRGASADKSIVAWPYYPSSRTGSAFLLGDVLALRCRADEYGAVLGPDTADQGLALIDLEAGEFTGTVGLAFENIVSLDAADKRLYLSTCEPLAAVAGMETPKCAYFITAINVAGAPSAGPSANVPGIFVQYDPGSGLLALRDDQWLRDWEYRSHLRTVRWDGGEEVESLDSVQLPSGASQVLGRGAKVYVESYADGLRLYAVAVSPGGALEPGSGVLVTKDWGSLLDARGSSAYVVLGGSAVARYDFGSGAGSLGEIVPVMGYPLRIRFGASTAYVSTGYSGVLELPL